MKNDQFNNMSASLLFYFPIARIYFSEGSWFSDVYERNSAGTNIVKISEVEFSLNESFSGYDTGYVLASRDRLYPVSRAFIPLSLKQNYYYALPGNNIQYPSSFNKGCDEAYATVCNFKNVYDFEVVFCASENVLSFKALKEGGIQTHCSEECPENSLCTYGLIHGTSLNGLTTQYKNPVVTNDLGVDTSSTFIDGKIIKKNDTEFWSNVAAYNNSLFNFNVNLFSVTSPRTLSSYIFVFYYYPEVNENLIHRNTLSKFNNNSSSEAIVMQTNSFDVVIKNNNNGIKNYYLKIKYSNTSAEYFEIATFNPTSFWIDFMINRSKALTFISRALNVNFTVELNNKSKLPIDLSTVTIKGCVDYYPGYYRTFYFAEALSSSDNGNFQLTVRDYIEIERYFSTFDTENFEYGKEIDATVTPYGIVSGNVIRVDFNSSHFAMKRFINYIPNFVKNRDISTTAVLFDSVPVGNIFTAYTADNSSNITNYRLMKNARLFNWKSKPNVFNDCPRNCKTCSPYACLYCDANFMLDNNNNCVGKEDGNTNFYTRLPIKIKDNTNPLLTLKKVGSTPEFTVSIFLKPIAMFEGDSTRILFLSLGNEQLKIKFVNNNRWYPSFCDDETAYPHSDKKFNPANFFGRWTNIGLSYHSDNTNQEINFYINGSLICKYRGTSYEIDFTEGKLLSFHTTAALLYKINYDTKYFYRPNTIDKDCANPENATCKQINFFKKSRSASLDLTPADIGLDGANTPADFAFSPDYETPVDVLPCNFDWEDYFGKNNNLLQQSVISDRYQLFEKWAEFNFNKSNENNKYGNKSLLDLNQFKVSF